MSDPNGINEPMFDFEPEARVDTSYLFGTNSTGSDTGPAAEPQEPQEPKFIQDHRLNRITKGEVFRQLQQRQILNDFGVPEFIYRADLIPVDLLQLDLAERKDILDAAIVPISFEYGYPSTIDAIPLWERLPGEAQNAYDAFCLALDLPEVSKTEHPVRLLPIIAPLLKVSLDQVAEYCHVYYWHIRFRAYDLFLAACHRKQREQRIMSIEGKHFRFAEKYLNKLDTVVEAKLNSAIDAISNEDENGELAELKLKDLIDMVEKLTRIQRISVGLPANGNDTSPSRDVGGRFQDVSDSYKEIAAHASPAKKSDTRSADMDALLQSPEELAAVQDLLIKFHTQG